MRSLNDLQLLGNGATAAGGQLVIPQAIKNHSAAYRDQMDLIKQWKDECLELSPDSEVSANSLYQSFKTWQTDNGFYAMNSQTFFRKTKNHLGNTKKKSDGNYYLGFSLKPSLNPFA